jgi:hypothetical protein
LGPFHSGLSAIPLLPQLSILWFWQVGGYTTFCPEIDLKLISIKVCHSCRKRLLPRHGFRPTEVFFSADLKYYHMIKIIDKLIL